MKTFPLALCLFGFLLPVFTSAQDQQHFEHDIASSVFDAERKIRVFLPERYFRDTTMEFMVTYVLDAQSDQVWNMACGNIDYLVSKFNVIPMIAVGVVSPNRSAEFNPESDDLRKHLSQEVFQLIQEKYRVQPFRAVVGHSWGGAFIGKTLFSEYCDMFDAYIGLSPSFDAIDNVIYKAADSLLQTNRPFRKFLFYSYGEVGFEAEYKYTSVKMDSLLGQHPNETLAWESRFYPKMDHFSAFNPALNDALVSMSRNYFADQLFVEQLIQAGEKNLLSRIKQFNQEQEANFGYAFSAPPNYYRMVASDLMRQEKDYDYALVLLNWVLEKDPDNVRLLVNIADAYVRTDDRKNGIPAIENALAKIEVHKDQVSERYYEAITKWLKEKLEAFKAGE